MKKILTLSMATLVALGMAGCAPAGGDGASSDVTLVVSRWAGESSEAQTELMKEFTAETGIKVQLDAIDYGQLQQKQTLSLSGPTAQYDLLMVHYTWLHQYIEEGWLAPVDEYLTDDALTGGDVDIADFAPSMIEHATVDGKFYGLPTNPAVPIFVYNEDLLDAAGLEVPTDWDSLLEVSKALSEAGTGIALPSSQAGSPPEIWNGFAHSLGGGIFDEAGALAMDSDANVEAMEYWAELNKYAVKGSNNFNWQDVNTQIQLGDAALGIVLSGIAIQLEDPDNSRVVGQLGYAPIPSPTGDLGFSTSSFFNWGVAANSEHPEEAFQLSAWLTSKVQLERLNLEIMPEVTARTSVSANPDIIAKLPFLSAVSEALSNSGVLPSDPNAPKLIDALGTAMSDITVNGADAKAALKALQDEFGPLYAG